jgi:tetratricopeptide (TPR) repeat protein
MTALAMVLVVQLTFPPAAPQQPATQQLFESGQYDELIQRVADAHDPSPAEIYLMGQSALKLAPPDREAAKLAYARLERGDEHAWTFIARSATALVDHAADEALGAAKQAVGMGPDQMFAHYQLGLAQAEKRAWTNAAAAFEKATTLDPTFAYAHYYAGLAYYQTKRVDKMAVLFERFLKLAPEAPEASAVQTIMRSIRR